MVQGVREAYRKMEILNTKNPLLVSGFFVAITNVSISVVTQLRDRQICTKKGVENVKIL